MNKKGQSLVEFIIILPIFIIILLGIIDFGSIFYNQNILENKLDLSVEILKKTRDKEEVEEYLNGENITSISWLESDGYLTLEIKKNYEFLTPGLNLIFPKPYKIEAKRVIYNE